jgi:enoyl-CoA hydratase/carnithine racemase
VANGVGLIAACDLAVVAEGTKLGATAVNVGLFCMGPAAGGLQIEWESQMIDVITPASPLGQKLLGKSVGEAVALSPGYAGSILRVD